MRWWIWEGSGSEVSRLSGLAGAAVLLLAWLQPPSVGLGAQPHQPHTLCLLHFQELPSLWHLSRLKVGQCVPSEMGQGWGEAEGLTAVPGV